MKSCTEVLLVFLSIYLCANRQTNAANQTQVPNKLPASTDLHFDVQISGFNSTSISSGPIILQDKRTIFVSNLAYKGSQSELSYWTGTSSVYGQKYLVARKPFLGNHSNVYIDLPSNSTLDNVTFLEVNDGSTLDYVIFDSVNKSAIRDYNQSGTDIPVYRIPKCCGQGQILLQELGCIDDLDSYSWNVTVFESNVTGLDPDIKLDNSQYDLRLYVYKITCEGGIIAGVGDSDIYGIIYNSSLIIQGEGIKAHNEFCMDISYDPEKKDYQTVTVVCYQHSAKENDSNLLYYIVMGISTVCFALTAASYGLLLNESDIIKKKCVIFFSASMFVVFLSLVILSVQSNYTVCRIFGFVFFTFTIFSFVWLSISCFELFYMVKVARENNRQAWRLHWYLGVSTGISILMLLISLFSGEEWTPDMPDTFIRNSNSCNFLVPFERFLILYIPMAISVIVAIVFIVLAQRLINKNDVDPRINIDCDWVANRNSYKFMCRTYMVIILATLFWFPHLFYNGVSSQLALDALEGALGILTLCTFVLDKYTMPKIWAKLKRKKKLNEASLGLQNIPTPTTAELEPSQETPFMFHGNAHNNHNTGNNNGG